jgi:hypothetical protein
MTIANPEYNPDWEELYTHHQAECKRLNQIPFDDLTEEEHAAMGEHSEQLRRCLDTYQHETFADAAKYVFERFDPADLAGLEGFIQPIDYDAFTSMAEINQAWKDADNAVRMIQTDRRSSMEVGQPDADDLPSDLFCDIGGNLQTAPQIFSNTWLGQTEVMTTIDRRDDAIYICFLNNNEGVSVVNAIEDFATVMRQQIEQSLKAEKAQQPGQGWKVGKMLSVFQGMGKPSMPELVFFQHVPPMEYRKETFSRVGLTLTGDSYSDPKWKELDRIPEYLQRLRREKDLKVVTGSSIKLLGKAPS